MDNSAIVPDPRPAYRYVEGEDFALETLAIPRAGATNLKVVISAQCDSNAASDAFIVTPHFTDTGATGTPADLLTGLASALDVWCSGTKWTLTAYASEKIKPNYPIATLIKNPTTGGNFASTAPREIALCISFYAQFNRPRLRGRVYAPWQWLKAHATLSAPAARPVTADRTAAMDLGALFAAHGGVTGYEWAVWSVRNQTGSKVTNYYVDDEWDTQRRRGRAPTTRTTATVP